MQTTSYGDGWRRRRRGHAGRRVRPETRLCRLLPLVRRWLVRPSPLLLAARPPGVRLVLHPGGRIRHRFAAWPRPDVGVRSGGQRWRRLRGWAGGARESRPTGVQSVTLRRWDHRGMAVWDARPLPDARGTDGERSQRRPTSAAGDRAR